MKGQFINVTDIETNRMARRPAPHCLYVFDNEGDAIAFCHELSSDADYNSDKVKHRMSKKRMTVEGAVFYLWVVTERVTGWATISV